MEMDYINARDCGTEDGRHRTKGIDTKEKIEI